MTPPGRLFALVAAGGTGTRLGGDLPKQLLPLAGRPVIAHAIAGLLDSGAVERVVVAMHPAWAARLEQALPADLPGRILVVPGGATRQESVLGALEVAAAGGADAVMIHDAARPLVSRGLVARVLAAYDGLRGVVPIVPVHDSVLLLREDRTIDRYLDRARLGLVQTPQLFPCAPLLSAHRAARGGGTAATDDASLFLAAGNAVATVEGDPANLKITWPSDLAVAEALLAAAGRG